MTEAPHLQHDLAEFERRLGRLRQAALGPDGAPSAARAALETDEEELRGLVEQSRWWPARSPGGPEQGHEALPVAVVVTDGEGMITSANGHALDLLGLRAGIAVGKPLPDCVALHSRPLMRTVLRALGADGSHQVVRLQLTPRDGEPREATVAVSAADSSSGTILRWVLVPDAGQPGREGVAGDRVVVRPDDLDVLAVGAAFAELARVPEDGQEPGRTPYERIADLASAAVPGAAHVSVAGWNDRGEPAALSATSAWSVELNAAQARLDEGPAVDALRLGAALSAVEADAARLWPRWVTAVDPCPRAVLALPLTDGKEVVGTIAVYSHPDEAADPAAHLTALAPKLGTYAAAAGAAVGVARRLQESRRHVRQLREALESRPVIDQAKGIIMVQRGCSADEAFAALVEVSQRRNVRVRLVAQQLVDSVTARRRH
ncbi:ANTAR domain-containing protein [Motilibacter deserti]|uniref:ANTAR domain-containing protein n=1 Tax=Motilibacter deserti TaxID=2714956 RepID=A0ABX0GS58_9ACTN|nr:ANTAR domain-containing protein [Motilibacter deserti]NHC13328.1 ANTAR domain-containing protein [Motilibacter deserti]